MLNIHICTHCDTFLCKKTTSVLHANGKGDRGYDRKIQAVLSKIEKVPRGIRGEKSSKDMTSSRNLDSTIGAQASPTMVGRNQVTGRVSVPFWHATPDANAPWKPLIIGEGQVWYQGHEIGGKSDWLGSHCWSRIRM